VNTETPQTGGGLRRIALTCLYFLIIAATLWVLGRVVARLMIVVAPVAVALMVAALLAPGVSLLVRRGMRKGLAAAVVLLVGVAAIGALVWFMVATLVAGLPDLANQLDESYQQMRSWLTDGPLGLTGDQLDAMLTEGKSWFSRNRSAIASGALGALSTAGVVLAGLVLVVFLLVFFLHDGDRMWRAVTSPLPERHRDIAHRAGIRAFSDLTSYVRVTVLVALIDAVGIGLGLWITGVPLVLPLSALVFLGAFVPIVGAFASGLVAVLVALVAQGPLVALIVAGVVVLVQQLEGNLFEPLLVSKSVKLHPVAVILAVAVGVEVAGIVGALFAVPLMAATRSVYLTLRERNDEVQESGAGAPA
jgi:predicted PurR-regulated permease PerM